MQLNRESPIDRRSRLRWTALAVAAVAVLPLRAGAQGEQYPWEEMQQQSFDAGAGGTLRVSVDDADVAVLESSGGVDVSIRLRSNDMEWARDRFERTNYRIRRDGDAVIVESDEEPDNSWRSGSWMSVIIEVHAPERFNLDLETQDGDISAGGFQGTARMISQDGDLTIDSLRGGEVSLITQDGDVTADTLDGPSVDIRSQDGDIRVRALAGIVIMRTGDGDIRIGSADTSSIDLESGDGDIHVAVTGNARMNLRTRDGDISIEAPSSLQADLDLSGEDVYIQGGFDLNGRVSSGRASGDLNGGGEQVQARTSDGTIRLVARAPR